MLSNDIIISINMGTTYSMIFIELLLITPCGVIATHNVVTPLNMTSLFFIAYHQRELAEVF